MVGVPIPARAQGVRSRCRMTWSDFYLFCFIVGFALSVLSFFAGAVHIHLPFKMHLPFHLGHHGGVRGAFPGGVRGGVHVSWFNASSAMAFLAWFGGTGYLLTRHAHLVALASLVISTVAGLAAGAVVFKFMVKLMHSDPPLKSEDYRIEGSLGTLSLPIRENGTGEIIFSLAGARRCAGARCEDGKPLEKGAEVVIERYEKGIAYVKRWEEFTRRKNFGLRREANSPWIERGGSYVWVANGSGGGCGTPGSCASDGDDCGRQNVSQGRAARSADRIRNGRHTCLHRQRRHHFSDGADLQGFVAGADVVRRRSAAEPLHQSGRGGHRRSGGANQSEVGQGIDSHRRRAVPYQAAGAARGADPAGDGRSPARDHGP